MLFRWVNAIIAIASPRLWHQIIWPNLYAPFHMLLIMNLNNTALSNAIHDAFKQHYKQLPHLTYTDIIDVLTQCTRLYSPSNHFKSDQRQQSTLGRECYKLAYAQLQTHKQAFEWSVLLATSANALDSLDVTWHDKSKYLKSVCQHLPDSYYARLQEYGPLIAHLKQTLPNQTVLYECDNHGEIWFDFLLIHWLLQHNCRVFLAAKATPVANDVTYDDLINLLDYPELELLKQAQKNQQRNKQRKELQQQ
mgnify:FL=1